MVILSKYMIPIEQSSKSDILESCSQLFQQSPFIFQKKSIDQNRKHKNVKQSSSSAQNFSLSALQQAQVKKIIQKVSLNSSKNNRNKQTVIRKTELQEDQMIYTKLKLQTESQIDTDQFYKALLNNSKSFALDLSENTISTKNYFTNLGLESSFDEIKKYFQWFDFNPVQSNHQKSTNRVLNFQKRVNYLAKLLHKNKSSYKVFVLNSSVQKSDILKISKAQVNSKPRKQLSLLKKYSVDNGFLNSFIPHKSKYNKKMTQSQMLQHIIDKTKVKYQDRFETKKIDNKNIYMTEQRKQALYQCQILKKVKRQIGANFYNNLILSYGNKHKNLRYFDQEKQNSQKINLISKDYNNQYRPISTKIINQKVNRNGACLKKKTVDSDAQTLINKSRSCLNEERRKRIEKITF